MPLSDRGDSTNVEADMMPVLRVNDGTFADLSTLKVWFGTKTPSETIDRLVREAMDQLGMERDDDAEGEVSIANDGAMEFREAPGLTFTKPTAASVNGKALKAPRWSSILAAMIGVVKAKGVEGAELVRELGIPARTDRYEDEGFKYNAELGVSIQGQSAADAWKEIDRIAKKWRIPVVVEFQWRENPKAQYPGKTGVLRSS